MRPLALAASLAVAAAAVVHGGLITSVPGPDDQGGMIMPQVFIVDTDDPFNPSMGRIGVSFDPVETPVLAGLQHWSPGDWFAAGAAWRGDLGSPAGVGGTPAPNGGRGDLFNCQYGFTFAADPGLGAAYVPAGKCLGIRLVAVSFAGLRAFNYDDFDNIWDEVLSPARPQVLWDGTMWHNYFTLPATAPPGTYTAVYEVFMANAEFQSGTGFVDYSPAALAAVADPAFIPTTVSYTWVVPAPPQATMRLVGGLPVISVPSTAGRTYQLEFKDNLTAPGWTALGTAKPGNGGVLEFTDTTTPLPARRIYQVAITP